MGKTSSLDTSPLEQPITVNTSETITYGVSPSGITPWLTDIYSGPAVIASSNAAGASTINVRYLIASATEGATGTHFHRNNATEREGTSTISLSNTYTYNGKTVYYGSGTSSARGPVITPASITPGIDIFRNEGAVAWTMIYGENEPNTQHIPVVWNSSYGEYQTSFPIIVT